MKKMIAITAGEPAGIGYDILIQTAHRPRKTPWLVFADPKALQERAALLHLPIKIETFKNINTLSKKPGVLTLWPTPCAEKVIPGKLNIKNSKAVLQGLTDAAELCLAQQASALVTLPVHKGIIDETGIPFTGHTEFFAKLCHVSKVVMMLASKKCRLALVTTHLPLKEVSKAITPKILGETITILCEYLKKYESIHKPRLLITGLNPHAGENGHLGHEEIETIIPTLNTLRETINAELLGPFAADTLFQPKYLDQADAIVAMYHDQGLTPLKALYFGEVVNITCGLPFLRTSVDHGVALDIAGTGQAKIDSFIAALNETERLISIHT